VIWKLRDGRIARILIPRAEPVAPRAAASSAVAPLAAPALLPTRALRGVAWAIGLSCAALYAFAEVEYEIGARRAFERADLPRARESLERRVWMGRDGAAIRIQTGLLEAEKGDLGVGIADLERAVSLQATREGYSGLASLYSRAGRHEEAIGAYQRALELDPGSAVVANNLAWLLALHRGGDAGSVERAIELAESASSALGDRNATALDTLAVAYAAAGRFEEARDAGRRALELARRAGDADQARELAERQARYRANEPYRVEPRSGLRR
jgi:spermidine synthase